MGTKPKEKFGREIKKTLQILERNFSFAIVLSVLAMALSVYSIFFSSKRREADKARGVEQAQELEKVKKALKVAEAAIRRKQDIPRKAVPKKSFSKSTMVGKFQYSLPEHPDKFVNSARVEIADNYMTFMEDVGEYEIKGDEIVFQAKPLGRLNIVMKIHDKNNIECLIADAPSGDEPKSHYEGWKFTRVKDWVE